MLVVWNRWPKQSQLTTSTMASDALHMEGTNRMTYPSAALWPHAPQQADLGMALWLGTAIVLAAAVLGFKLFHANQTNKS